MSGDWSSDVCSSDLFPSHDTALPYNWAPSYRVYFKGETRLQVVLRRCYTLDEIEAKRFGMNPVATAWELTTLSFVIDWFISVGDFIAAYTPTRASSAKHAESTTRPLVS